MANDGKRIRVVCKKQLTPCEYETFERGKIYRCSIRDEYWCKVYGKEFSLSCNIDFFNKYFKETNSRWDVRGEL